MVPLVFLCAFAATSARIGRGEDAGDSVPSAVTVYRNPAFFDNVTEPNGIRDEGDRDDLYDAADFFDYGDDVLNLEEPAGPDPPEGPDFAAHYGESPQNSSRIGRAGDSREGDDAEKDPRPSIIREDSSKGYESSRHFFNPFIGKVLSSYDQRVTTSDCKCPSNRKMELRLVSDAKRGTREYLRDHPEREPLEPPPVDHGTDSRRLVRIVPEIRVKTVSPVYAVPYVQTRYKSKLKLMYAPAVPYRVRNQIKVRIVRDAPVSGAYQRSGRKKSKNPR